MVKTTATIGPNAHGFRELLGGRDPLLNRSSNVSLGYASTNANIHALILLWRLIKVFS
jgi:hypothetical protein